MRTTILAGAFLFVGALAHAQAHDVHFGVSWGQSAQEVAEAAKATVLSRAVHQRYGLAYELDRLPVAFGGEIHRILYFDDDDQLHRMWIDFGHPGERAWAENYFLDEAIAKYRELKADVERRQSSGDCAEPELQRIEVEGRIILDQSFGRNQTVWVCEFQRGETLLKISVRRLGDIPGERFDVIFDAQDQAAVTTYQNLHRLRRPD